MTPEKQRLPRCTSKKRVRVMNTSSSIRTVTVGPGVSPGQPPKRWVADYTASGESHPALKTFDPVVLLIIRYRNAKSKPGRACFFRLSKNLFFDSLAEVKEAPKTNKSNSSAYDGTVEFDLCSKSKHLAKQGFLQVLSAPLHLIRPRCARPPSHQGEGFF